MENSYYIPINSGSLAHYFGKAIILPARYFINKPEDIQNKFSDSLLICGNKWVKNSDCSIEVVLTDTEVKTLFKLSEHFFLYNTPIPISRVKSVCFLDTKQKETTIWNINNGAAFIPEKIISVEKAKDVEVISDSELITQNQIQSTTELSDKIKKFDIILGGFAFMRLGGKSFMNYSENYFSTLSYFNKLIEEQTLNAVQEKGFKFSNKYIGLFSKQESEWSRWQQYIYQNLDAHEIEVLADKEGIKIEKKLGLIKLDSINPSSHLYELAILATYGDRKNKSIDNLVTDLTNGTIFPEKVETVSILFGLNNGYSKLRNKYKGASKEDKVKFTLESKLDYYIIESIYQFVFNISKSSYSFEYIDRWCPTSVIKNNIKGYETYKILDTVVIAKKKQTHLEFFLENYSKEIYSTIVKSINQWLPPFVKYDERDAIEFFEEQLRAVFTKSIESIQKRIEVECDEDDNSKIEELSELQKKKIDIILEDDIKLKKGERASLENKPTAELLRKDESEVKIERENVNISQESISEISMEYESMSLPELKKLAKEKKVKGYTKIDNKEELIKLLKKAPPTLL